MMLKFRAVLIRQFFPFFADHGVHVLLPLFVTEPIFVSFTTAAHREWLQHRHAFSVEVDPANANNLTFRDITNFRFSLSTMALPGRHFC